MPTTHVQQGIIRLIYLTFLHNADAIALFVGCCLMIWLLLRHPRRCYVLFLIGFFSLLLRFEYLKHIVEPLESQTTTTVLQEDGHERARRGFDLLFNDVIPLGLWIIGWGGVFGGAVVKGADQRFLKQLGKQWTKLSRIKKRS